MESSWLWVIVAAGPGAVALALLLLRRQGQVERDAQMEELRGLSREIVDAEMAAIRGHVAELKRGREEERAELARLREEVEGLRQGVAALLAQIREARLVPVWEPPTTVVESVERGGEGVDLAGLQRRLARHFSLEEMEELVLRLALEGEEIWPGAATRQARARELVKFMERRGRLEELVALCRELRKSVRW